MENNAPAPVLDRPEGPHSERPNQPEAEEPPSRPEPPNESEPGQEVVAGASDPDRASQAAMRMDPLATEPVATVSMPAQGTTASQRNEGELAMEAAAAIVIVLALGWAAIQLWRGR